MFKLKDIGTFTSLPELAMHIYEGNLSALRDAIAQGWDMEQEIRISQYTTVIPLELAIIMEQFEVIKLLIEHGVNLNHKKEPSFLLAVRYCEEEIIRYVVAHGAKIDALDHLKSNAYVQAYYGKKHNFPLIHELGLDAAKYGGYTLRKAVDARDWRTIEFMLQHGVDINFNKPDMVYPYCSTPLTAAARNGDLKMVRYLVEHGADVCICEKGGDRAYTIAVQNKDSAMAEYLKSLEPAEFHSIENKRLALKSYKLPQNLIDFLIGDKLRIELPDNDYEIGYIEFFPFTETIEMKAGRKKLLRLSAGVDNYTSILLVWNPKTKCIGYYDEEHQEYSDVCSFEDFLALPELYLTKIVEGELVT
ncbi:ankyrin repeat domain-containing protein [Paenibacillus alvei]|uniref:ankyrin repeat domain-containing protein n=1 Tax=Paenibacillus alvei TaxID=44250 RepID=UPI00227E9120|nr:ankyrin repeat domain-containing protein [Paenibacillus alvei]MCY7483139.1 ankyrin repeat domain-containing protein [Paenibacillus alvei]